MADAAAQRLAARFRWQATRAVVRDAPLMVGLLNRVADDLEQGGALTRPLLGRADEPRGWVLPLRLMAAVHRLVLTGAAEELRAVYPSADRGVADAAEVWPAFAGVLGDHAGEIDRLLDRPLQTNEVGRCAALLVGFAAVTAEHALPLATLELGASAGLNLHWDRFRYDWAGGGFGPEDATVRLSGFDAPVAIGAGRPPVVVARAGCDLAPLDPADAETRLTLRSCVWADQLDRLVRLEAALDVARAHAVPVERADAADWLERRLGSRRAGATTVVYQSIVDQYLSADVRARIVAVLEAVGATATPAAPLAWVRIEPPAEAEAADDPDHGLAEIRVRTWPSGVDRVVGRAGYHGRPTRPRPAAGVGGSAA